MSGLPRLGPGFFDDVITPNDPRFGCDQSDAKRIAELERLLAESRAQTDLADRTGEANVDSLLAQIYQQARRNCKMSKRVRRLKRRNRFYKASLRAAGVPHKWDGSDA